MCLATGPGDPEVIEGLGDTKLAILTAHADVVLNLLRRHLVSQLIATWAMHAETMSTLRRLQARRSGRYCRGSAC